MPIKKSMDKFSLFIETLKSAELELQTSLVPNSELLSRLNLPESDFIQIRNELVCNGCIKRTYDNEKSYTTFIKDYQPQPLLESISPMKLQSFANLLELKSYISFEHFSYNVKEIKQFKILIFEHFGLQAQLDFEKEIIQLIPKSKIAENLLFESEHTYYFEDEDQRSVVNKLIEWFDFNELYQFAGELGQQLLKIVRIENGSNQIPTSFQIATALVLKYGKNLFVDNLNICEEIYRKHNLETKYFTAGTIEALEFVTQFNLPKSFAGLPNKNIQSDHFSSFSALEELNILTSEQSQTAEQIITLLKNIGTKIDAVVPTGANKNRIALESISSWLKHFSAYNKKNLVLYFTQNYNLHNLNLKKINYFFNNQKDRNFAVDVVDGHQSPHLELPFQSLLMQSTSNTVCALHTMFLEQLCEANQLLWFKKLCSEVNLLVVVDEVSPNLNSIFNNSLQIIQKLNSDVSILSLSTAHLNSSSGVLSNFKAITVDVYSNIDNLIMHQIENKNLAQPTFAEIETHFEVNVSHYTEINELTTDAIDNLRLEFLQSELIHHLDLWQRQKPIIKYISELCADPKNKIVYYGLNQNDTHWVSWGLRILGVSSVSDIKEINNAQVLCSHQNITFEISNNNFSHIVFAQPHLIKNELEQYFEDNLIIANSHLTKHCQLILVRDILMPHLQLPLAFETIATKWQKDLTQSSTTIQISEQPDVGFSLESPSNYEFNDINIAPQDNTSNEVEIKFDLEFLPADETLQIENDNLDLVQPAENLSALEIVDESANLTFEYEQSAEVAQNDEIIEPIKIEYDEVDHMNIRNKVDTLFNWIFNEMVIENHISSDKMLNQFKLIDVNRIDNFFQFLGEKLGRPVSVEGKNLKIESDTALASKLSVNKLVIKDVIKTDLIMPVYKSAA